MDSIVTELQSVQFLLIWNHQIFVLATLGIHFRSLVYEDQARNQPLEKGGSF